MKIPVSSSDHDLRECATQLELGVAALKQIKPRPISEAWYLSIGLRCMENALALLLAVVPGVREAEAIEEARGE